MPRLKINEETSKEVRFPNEPDGSLETGYLNHINNTLHVLCKHRVEDPTDPKKQITIYEAEPWGDFGIKALGRYEDEGKTAWDVLIVRQHDKRVFREVLYDTVLADSKKLTTWLMGMALSVGDDGSAVHRFAPGVRLNRYLQSQNPPCIKVVEKTGWDAELGGYVTGEGIIYPGSTALDNTSENRLDPRIQRSGMLPATPGYAHGGLDEVREILNELMYLHDEVPMAIITSWAVMSVIQSSLVGGRWVSFFPSFGIEAPSGAAKTTGSPAISAAMITGNSMTGAKLTLADLRDRLAVSRSGYVHVDDVDDPKAVFELFRLATNHSSHTKKNAADGWQTSVTRQMTCSGLITGEHLGLYEQKAMADRFILIGLSHPAGRRSRRNPGHSQAEDLRAIQRRYADVGGITSMSATVIAELLLYVENLCHLAQNLNPMHGRNGEKFGILLAGARFVDHLRGEPGAWLGNGETSTLVQEWVRTQIEDYDEWDNFLTREILPWAINQFEPNDLNPVKMIKGMRFDFPPVVFYNDFLYFHPRQLAVAWEAWKGNKVETRTQSQASFEAQAKAAGFQSSVLVKVLHSDGSRKAKRMWKASSAVSELIIARAEGESK